MAASQALYGQNDDDFWTSDDEEISEPDGTEGDLTEEDVQATDSNDAAASGGEHKEVATQQYLPPAYMNYLAAEDITASPNFVSGPSPIPSSAVVAPKPSMIRKSWVVVDDNPVDDFQTAVPNPALRFPFELDPFQKRAIKHVHHREHTFVAAHTSAGKTVVAEYAIAVAAQRGRRAIYTSPIKALSNQKFREFKQKFDSVGIITGDVSLNPDAQCLIATTEILRAMLYRGDSILNQLDVVIFDEVHYVNDVERGVVWEEVIIMLARDVCLVMLSATVPNFREFADWIGRTKRREVFAIATTRRPTPLKHFLWANDKEFLIMDQSRFRVEAFNELYKNRREVAKTVAAAPSKTPSRGGRGGKTGPNKQQRPTGRGGQQLSGSGGGGFARQSGGAKTKTDSQRLQALIRRLEQESQLPVVVFCFSRKRCEGFPSAMGRLDLLHQQDERSRVHVFIKESFSALPEADRRLPQVIQVTQFLSRGIGVHHGGLLPIVKEAVEILFARGLVKVLFATETFAMGVNMPARSVVFASVEKHDGQRMRMLTSSEYTQMAGRAGRRGLDTFGSVYILCQSDDPPDQKDLTEMMLEKANPLQSRFRLTYAMLLQLASQQSLRIEDMMSLSFREHSRAQRAPTLKRDHARVLHELDAIPPIECIYGNPDAIVSYAETEFCSRSLAHQLHQSLWKYQYALCNTPQAQGGTGVLFASPAGGSSAPFCRGRVVVVHSTPKLTCSTVAVILGLERAIPLSSASRFTQKIETPRFRVLALRQRCHSTQGSQSVPELSETIQSMLEALRNPFQPSRKTNHSSTIQVMLSGSLYGAEMGSFEPGAASEYEIIRAVPLDYFGVVTSHVLSVPSLTEEAWTTCFEGTDEAAVQLVAKALNTLNIGCKGQWTPLALSKNLRSVEIEFVETLLAQKDTLEKLNNSICHNCQLKEHHFTLVERRNACKALQKDIETLLRVDSLHLYDEMRLRYQFLRKRQYIDVQGCITLKGQVAAALSTNDDITITEALLSNVFRGKDPEEAAALLSCFVFPDKVQEVPRGPTEGIAEGRDQIEALHHAIENEMKALRIMVVHEEWWRLCNFGLSAIVYRWANGEGFATIMESTDIQEGTIVRAILRLDELVRKIRSVAKTLLDDSALEALMEETSNRIRRDVVFAISLYLK